jgi:hypothetical protein
MEVGYVAIVSEENTASIFTAYVTIPDDGSSIFL